MPEERDIYEMAQAIAGEHADEMQEAIYSALRECVVDVMSMMVEHRTKDTRFIEVLNYPIVLTEFMHQYFDEDDARYPHLFFIEIEFLKIDAVMRFKINTKRMYDDFSMKEYINILALEQVVTRYSSAHERYPDIVIDEWNYCSWKSSIHKLIRWGIELVQYLEEFQQEYLIEKEDMVE